MKHAVPGPDFQLLQNPARPDAQKGDIQVIQVAVADLDGERRGGKGEKQIALGDIGALLCVAEAPPSFGDEVHHIGGFGDELVALGDDRFIDEIDGVDLIGTASCGNKFTDVVVHVPIPPGRLFSSGCLPSV